MATAGPEYHDKFNAAFDKELEYVETRWRAKNTRRWEEAASFRCVEATQAGDLAAADAIAQETEPRAIFDKNNLVGLALSGGGIRSASFCMGVVQQLHVAGVIDRLHYMSTVSGGGYTGSSLSWFLSQPEDKEGRRFGTQTDNFPFCGGEPAGTRLASEPRDRHGVAPVDGRTVLDYIRQRASYLNPGAGFSIVSAIAIVLRSILTSVFGFVLLAALASLAILHFELFRRPLGTVGVDAPDAFDLVNRIDLFAASGLALLALIAVSILLYSLASAFPLAEKAAYSLRRGYQKTAGFLVGAAGALFVLSLLHLLIDTLLRRELGGELAALGTASTGMGAAGGLILRSIGRAKPTVIKSAAIALMPGAALLLLVAGIVILGHLLADLIFGAGARWEIAFAAGVIVYAVFTNINLTGFHRFYRDRLMESFMPDPARIVDDGQAAETRADEKKLSDICGPEDDGPYHLINAHVVLLGAKKARQRSRQGDSFVLSRLYCGSEATGYVSTADWLPGPGFSLLGRRVGAMRLPTAMAISGAALNPRAGADGQGSTKGGAISALLNLLNLRLGYWVPSPAKLAAGRARPSFYTAPNFLFPGLSQGLFGFFHNETANWLELSDGGHFENTGMYELVRRGVRTIVFADGSTDPEIALQSFANALEKVYIDFNVQVTFDEKDLHFTGLMKGSSDPDDHVAKKLELAKAGYAIGTIRYPKVDGKEVPPGTLIYIKSTMVRDLPAALYSYKAVNPVFPSESLADQFFSEQQFEAYRALGFALTRAMTGAAKGQAWGRPIGL
jgi:hypothetical protein